MQCVVDLEVGSQRHSTRKYRLNTTVDSNTFIFTSFSGGGATYSPVATSPMGTLVALGNSLMRYGQASPAQLVESEKRLTLQLEATAKSLGADISATAHARTWNPPIPCLESRRE
jgi:hypothetical protein